MHWAIALDFGSNASLTDSRFRPIGWCLLSVVYQLLLLSTAATGQSSSDSLLTVQRLFADKEFETETVPELHWSQLTSHYFVLRDGRGDAGQELVRIDPGSGVEQVVASAAQFTPAGTKQPLKIEGFQFSADERRLLLYTNSQRVWRQNTRGDYWVLDLPSQQLRKMGSDAPAASLMYAKFSPDGTQVAYVRQNNLYVEDLASGTAKALTTDGSDTLIYGTGDWVNEEELSLRDCFRWSPDGRQLLFWQFDTHGVPVFQLVDYTSHNYPRITSFAYPKVGELNSATRLGVVTVENGGITWLNLPGNPREHYVPRAEWSTDGQRILVQQFNRLQSQIRLLMVEPGSGVPHPVMTETDNAWLENDNPIRWLDDGRSFLWLSERSGWRQAYRVSLADARLTALTPDQQDVIEIDAVATKPGWLYFSASPHNATQRYLYRTTLAGDQTQQVTPATQAGWHSYDISPDGQWALHTWSAFTQPPTVEIVRLADHQVVQTLTENRQLRDKLASLKQVDVQFLKVEIEDGIVLDGWSIWPQDSTARVPLLMHVYGEPHGQTVRDAWPGPRGLWHWMLAQRGIVIASVDNRGTNVPRGRAWRKSVHRQVGVPASQEQAQAVRQLLHRWPTVDPARVGVWGWSGGGSMSLNAIFRYPDLYHTAVAIAPVPDQRLYDTIYQERYMGLPSDNVAGYREGSPITFAENLRGNLLLIHGTGDDNCHYQGSERLIDALIAHGKQFSLFAYPNRTHSVREGTNTVPHFWELIARFLMDNLQQPAR